MKLTDLLNEKIVIDVEVGDTILAGRFKNKKISRKTLSIKTHTEQLSMVKKLLHFVL